jgi:cholesterol transport system auxiliary component
MNLSRFAASLLLLTLGGCVNVNGLEALGRGDKPVLTVYQLDDAPPAAPAGVPRPFALLVSETVALGYYDTDGMVFSKSPGTRGVYQYARWTERPGRRFADLLVQRLRAQQGFQRVMRSDSGVRGKWLISTTLAEFYHDAQKSPGAARVQLRAVVIDIATSEVVGQQDFAVSVPAQAYSAAGVYPAFTSATRTVLDQLSAWIVQLPTSPAGAAHSLPSSQTPSP